MNANRIKNSQDYRYKKQRFLMALSIFLLIFLLKWTYIVWINENIVLFEKYSILSLIDSFVTSFSWILIILFIYVFICAYRLILLVKRSKFYVYGTAVLENASKVGVRRYIFVVSFCDKDGNIKKTRTDKIFTSHGLMDIKKWSGHTVEAAYDSYIDRVVVIKTLKK